MDENQQSAAPVENNDDWSQASNDFLADKGLEPVQAEEPKKPEVEAKKPDEPAKPVEEEKKPEAPKPPENETPEEKTAREAKEAEAAKTAEEKPAQPDNPAVRDARQIQREMAADEKVMKADIREKMFSDVQAELTDADGDPIRTPADVMKLMNPNTKKPFTEEEATAYLFQAQKHLEKQLSEVATQVDKIAETNLTIKDWSDSVRSKYGELLQALPNVRQQVWAAYEKTLVKDAKTGIIIDAPVSLEEFYDIALKPYAVYAARLEAEATSKEKTEEKIERKRTQSDRSDVYVGGKGDTMDPDEREWAKAAKEYYEI